MGDHLESFTTRVWDVGVSRHAGHAAWLMHEEPGGSGDVVAFGPYWPRADRHSDASVIRVNLVCLSPTPPPGGFLFPSPWVGPS